MSRAEKLREELKKTETAQKRAKKLLGRRFSQAEKNAIFESVQGLACEWLQHRLNHSTSNRHIDEAFEERVVTSFWGEDIYKWVYDL